jgi:membrane-associated protease RseP (regulator of RpoE activity)
MGNARRFVKIFRLWIKKPKTMRKLNKTLLLAIILGLGTVQFHSLFAQEKNDKTQQIIIIEETTDENGTKKTRKIVTKGTDLSDEDVEKILFDIEQMSKDIKIIDDENGKETIIIKEFRNGEEEADQWEVHSNELKFENQKPKPTLGIMLGNFSDHKAEIDRVVKGSGAEDAGLKKGDHITTIGETKISSYEDVMSALAEKELGDNLNIVYEREGKEYTAQVELKNNDFGFAEKKKRKTKPSPKVWKKKKHKSNKGTLGVMIEQEDDQVFVDDVIVGSAAEKAGLKVGDDITTVNGETIDSYEDLIKAVQLAVDSDGTMDIEYDRAGKKAKTKAQLK